MTTIEWTDSTWNPVAGCSVLSPGCTNCYAMRMAARLDAMGVPKYAGLTRKSGGSAKWTGKIRLDDRSLSAPFSWKSPRMVFVNSMSDLFHQNVPIEFIEKVWNTMAETPRHTYQILTKRPDRMAELTARLPKLSNVWLGTSVESKDYLFRLDELRLANAYIRFISFEPLISSVGTPNLASIDWAIVGGESGPKARPIDPDWVEEIYGSCRQYSTAFFFKQWGGKRKHKTGRLLHGRTYDEFPAQQRLQLANSLP
jgi:protein gp37